MSKIGIRNRKQKKQKEFFYFLVYKIYFLLLQKAATSGEFAGKFEF